QMLPELRRNATWQTLAERAEREDARASARTKAGHAKRAKTSNASSNTSIEDSRQEYDKETEGESLEPARDTEQATNVGAGNQGRETSVADSNTGLEGDVEPGNNALGGNRATIADQRNEGDPNSVELGNSTYNQTSHTTTTTTTASFIESDRPDSAGAGPLLGPSLAVVTCFEAANDRSITPLEADLLAELERACASSAQRSGETGADWVVAAIREAVGSGSRFVAPKRINEILNRWSKSHPRDGLRTGAATTTEGVTNGSLPADFPLPTGRGSQATWEQALRLLSAVIERAEMERFFAGSGITGYQAGTVRVRVASREAAERLSGEYYELVSRKLAEAMRRPVRIEFSAPGASPETAAAAVESERPPVPEKESPSRPERPLPLPNFMLAGGLTNQQIWSSALEVLAGRVSAATWQTWLRPAALIGTDEDGTLVLGAPNAFARQRLSGHLLDEVARALAGLLERPVTLRVVVTQEWLRQRANDEPVEPDDEDGT
ncbi:MAG TPA: DnaA N-terminal domain-containing protein, partial [Nitrolancea sp.]